MDFPNVSAYDNVNLPVSLSKSSIYRKLNNLLNVNIDFEVRIFCPLCVKNFNSKFSLFEHLRTFHNAFLTQASNQALKFTECPFCNAKFLGKHLTVKHVLHDHSKVVIGLFTNKNNFKCFFCNMRIFKEDHNYAVKHVEDFHFFDFEEELTKMFSCDTIQEMSVSEFINTTVEEEEAGSGKWEDVCMNIGKHSGCKNNNSSIENFDEASVINCYDFTDLKQQLENLKESKSVVADSANKSILKGINNSKTHRWSARRVLRFDLPSESEDKENLTPEPMFSDFNEIDLDEYNLLSNDQPNAFFKLSETFCAKPKHSSTPNSKCVMKSENKKKSIKCNKSNFKSYITKKKSADFEFQCGKCRLLFKENCELVSHIKNNHKNISFNVFQPCYHCAICGARFYKNYYLRKHHNLHKPY